MARDDHDVSGSGTVAIRVLGPMELHRDGEIVDIGHARQRAVLALLAVQPGTVVSGARLVEQLWPGPAGQRARDSLYSYLSRLRKCLLGSPVAIRRRSGGYLLDIAPTAVDMHRFRDLVARARRGGGVAEWEAALALWRGEPFVDLDVAALAELRATLDAEHFAAVLDRNDALLRHGDAEAALPLLRDLAERHPWDERLAGQLLLALHRGGHRAEAVEHYRELTRRLIAERGTSPGPALVALRRGLERGETADPVRAASPAAPTPPVPRQLPGDIPGFTGRDEQLRRLDALLDSGRRTVVISAVTGTAGIGKTALAVRWAHRVADRFPDGQLYLNLRGFDPSGRVVTPQEAVRGFLEGLGVSANRIPADVDDQAALFRDLTANRRLLVVLDNARDAAQVRPLLPGGADCLALVTSRDTLAGLLDPSEAGSLPIDRLSPADSRRLLASRLGPDRATAADIDALAEACARLPLALSVVAARAVLDPEVAVPQLLAALRDEHSALDLLDGGEAAVNLRAVFSWSYRELRVEAAAAFRLLGLCPGGTVTPPTAASLLGGTVDEASTLLRELAEAHLVEEPVPGRYGFHDLLAAYARELAEAEDEPRRRTEAVRRLVDHRLHSAKAATALISPGRVFIPVEDPGAGVTPQCPADRAEALAWFAAEHADLMATVALAHEAGFDALANQLAWMMGDYLSGAGYENDLITVQNVALAAARRCGDRRLLCRSLLALGRAYNGLQRDAEAEAHLFEALRLGERLGHLIPQTSAHSTLAMMYNRQGRHELALEHHRIALDMNRRKETNRDSGVAMALNNIGYTLACLGDYPQALKYGHLSFEACVRMADAHGQMASLDTIGYVHHRAGRYREAVESFTEALELVDLGTGERLYHTQTSILVHLAETHEALGQFQLAAQRCRQALSILEEADHPQSDEIRDLLRRLESG